MENLFISQEVRELMERLEDPFDPGEIKWKPQVVKNNRCMAIGYIDARLVAERLDREFGFGWKDRYELLADGSVRCELSVWVGGQWVTREDVGGQSEQPDGGDRLKSAFSDALKRVGVKFGIGRYLYRLPQVWVDYDPQTKKIVKPPQLPEWALPKGYGKKPELPARPAANVANAGKSPSASPAKLPVDGNELRTRLLSYETAHKIAPGSVQAFVLAEGMKAGYPDDLSKWVGESAMKFAAQTVSRYGSRG